MGQATVPFTNEPLNPQPLPLEPMKVEDTKEPLEPLEMAAERIEKLQPVEPIHPIMKLESEITLKKLEPYELVKPTIPDELMEPLESPEIMPNLIETPMIIPEVDQELLELMREPEITIDESDPFEFPKPGLLVTQGKVNGLDASFLFDTGCLPNVLSYDMCNRLNIKIQKRPEYVSVMANKTHQEIGETIEPVTIDLHYYKEKLKFVVAPCQYDIILGKNWETKHKAKINCENNSISFKHEGIEYYILANESI